MKKTIQLSVVKSIPTAAILLATLVTIAMPSAGFAQLRPDEADEHMDAAKSYMTTEQWGYASYEWRAALAANPNNAEAHVGLAETLIRSGYTKDAVRHLAETRKSMDKLSIELAYGQALERNGQALDAERIYLRILERVPLEANAFNRLIALQPRLSANKQKSLQEFLERKSTECAQAGRLALKHKQYDEAVGNFAISTSYNPNIKDLNDYGVALLLLGQYDEAHQQFALLNRADIHQWEFYANTALVALGKGRSAEAATDVEKAISLCADNTQKPLLYNLLGFVYENQSKWAKARNAYERSIELNPGFTKAKLNLAYVYQKDMAYPEAIHTYRELLKNEPLNALLWNRLGFVYELANKERLAISSYQNAISANSNDQEGYLNLAMLYRKMGKTKAADRAYKSVMRLEFADLEHGHPAGPSSKSISEANTASRPATNNRDPKSRLLEYVDVFFSQS